MQAGDVPLFGVGLLGNVPRHQLLDHVMAHVVDGVTDVFLGHQFLALLVDHLALIVHHVVELEQVLADLEVAGLDFLLRLLERLVDPRMDDGLTLLESQLLEHSVDALGPEDPHQVVFERQIELRSARVALAARPSTQLIVHPPAFVTFGAEDEQPAGGEDLLSVGGHLGADAGLTVLVAGVVQLLLDPHVGVAAKLNIGAAAGHVGSDGHGSVAAGLGDDERLLLVIARVQHLVGDLPLLERGGEGLGLFDADRAHQNRLAAFAAVQDLLDDGRFFLLGRPIDLVMLVLADASDVGRDIDDLETVDFGELAGFRHRRAGHPGEFGIEPEVVLEGDRGQGLVFLLDGHAFLGLQGLVKTFRVAAPLHHPAGELVDDHHLVFLDDVVSVAAEQDMRPKRLVGVMNQRHVGQVVEAALGQKSRLPKQLFHALHAGFGVGSGAALLVLFVMLLGKLGDQRVDARVKLGRILGRTGDDERRPRLVDQDGVHLVDDGVMEGALDHFLQPELHVVAEVVESEFVVGAVGDVARIGLLAAGVVEAMDDAPDG